MDIWTNLPKIEKPTFVFLGAKLDVETRTFNMYFQVVEQCGFIRLNFIVGEKKEND